MIKFLNPAQAPHQLPAGDTEEQKIAPRKFDQLRIHFHRLVLKNLFPDEWFRDPMPKEDDRKSVSGHFLLEIVSHCWQYSNTLAYQLSSLVNYPPKNLTVKITVFYAKEDHETKNMLDFFSQQTIENVIWNWQVLPKKQLFRRAIGRNAVARSTQADWVWFTDCDIIFHENCLDSLAASVQNKTLTLIYPRQERTTPMLATSDPMLKKGRKPQIVDIEADKFELHSRDKAKGAYQIVHGDVVRAIGYCDGLKIFQSETERWRKTYEDSVYRGLLGTDGEPMDITGVYQIRHIHKGRYKKSSWTARLRSKVRRIQE